MIPLAQYGAEMKKIEDEYNNIFVAGTVEKPQFFRVDSPQRLAEEHASSLTAEGKQATSDNEGNVYLDGRKVGHYEDKEFVPIGTGDAGEVTMDTATDDELEGAAVGQETSVEATPKPASSPEKKTPVERTVESLKADITSGVLPVTEYYPGLKMEEGGVYLSDGNTYYYTKGKPVLIEFKE